jgi:hypothetical protein
MEESELGITPLRAFRAEPDFFAEFGENARS